MEAIWEFLRPILFTGIALLCALVALNLFKKKLTAKAAETPGKNDDIAIKYLFKALRWGLYYFAVMFLLQGFGIQSNILGYAGSFVGAAFAFSSKPLFLWVGNVFKVVFLKPLKEGEYMHFKNVGVEGIIVDVGWDEVKVFNDNKKEVRIPLDLALKGVKEVVPDPRDEREWTKKGWI